MDALDAVLCAEGILDRTPLRGAQRRLRGQRLTPAELVAGSQIAAQYRAAHQRYLEVYAQRVSNVHEFDDVGHECGQPIVAAAETGSRRLPGLGLSPPAPGSAATKSS